MNSKMKFGECWDGKFAEIAKLIENGIKCSGWHMAATGSAHFGKCIDFTFDYIPNFNVTIYHITTVDRISTSVGMDNVVGWIAQYIVMSNKRELFRFNTDVTEGDKLERYSELLTVFVSIALIDKISRLRLAPNRRFIVETLNLRNHKHIKPVLYGYLTHELVECPIIIPTSSFDYLCVMLYQLFRYYGGSAAHMLACPSYSFSYMIGIVLSTLRTSCYNPWGKNKLNIIVNTASKNTTAVDNYIPEKLDCRQLLAKYGSKSETEQLGRMLLWQVGFIPRDIDVSIYGGLHNLRSSLYRLKEEKDAVRLADFDNTVIIQADANDWNIVDVDG